MALASLLRRAALAFAPPTSGPALTTPTPAHFDALAALVGSLPASELVALIQGRASLSDDLDLARRAVAIVAAAFPGGALTAQTIEMALQALSFLLGAAANGGAPIGVAPGQNSIRGGFSGARGHI